MHEIDEKVDRLARLATRRGLGGILLNTQPNFAWLTGGRSNQVDGSRENGSGPRPKMRTARRPPTPAIVSASAPSAPKGASPSPSRSSSLSSSPAACRCRSAAARGAAHRSMAIARFTRPAAKAASGK